MRRLVRGYVLWCVLGALSVSSTGMADDKPATYDRKNVQILMRQKLEHMKNVVEGMSSEDYAMVNKNLDAMEKIAQTATWKMIRTDDYQRYSRYFQDAIGDLKKALEKEDKTLAAMPYMRLSMSCIECHDAVRSHVVGK